MTYTPEQEMQLRSTCHTLADGYTPEVFNWFKELLAEDGIELKEPTEADKITEVVGRSIYLSSEMIRGFDEEELIAYVGKEVAGALIRTVKYGDLCKANGITLNAPKKEEK